MKIVGTISAPQRVVGVLTPHKTVTANLTIPSAILPPAYEGSYVVTPGDQSQILNTSELYMTDNVTIEAIPNNYGLITYDGTALRIS